MKLKGWKDIPIGAVIPEAGNAEEYETGAWRSDRPILDLERCTNCGICWVYCPDATIVFKDGKMLGFDLKHCKGCGICAATCPRVAIKMIVESAEEVGV